MSSSVEIERKFLVSTLPEGFEEAPQAMIRQGYLALDESSEVRLRDKGGRCFLTVKSSGGLVRTEHEIILSRAQFETLWPATAGRRLEKTRYELEHQGMLVELDVYGGDLEGLATAEVEFASVDAASAFSAPPWFAADVTEDGRYKNRELALYGAP